MSLHRSAEMVAILRCNALKRMNSRTHGLHHSAAMKLRDSLHGSAEMVAVQCNPVKREKFTR